MAKASTANREDAAGAGHNSGGLTSDQRHALALQHRRNYRVLDSEKKRIATDLLKLGRSVKADLGDTGMLQIKTMIRAETEEGAAAIEAERKALAEARAWVVGDDGQFDMFSGQPKPDETQAFLDGKLSGMDDEPLQNPYGGGTADHEDFARGWHVGRKVLDELLSMRAEAEIIEGAGHDDGGDLDDEAADEAA